MSTKIESTIANQLAKAKPEEVVPLITLLELWTRHKYLLLAKPDARNTPLPSGSI